MFSSRAAINTGSPDLGRVVSPILGRGFAADTKGCGSAADGHFSFWEVVMYSDTTLIRKHRVNLSFNDREAALVNAYCEYTGEEKAAFIRALILDRAEEVLAHAMQSASATPGTRDAQSALFGAWAPPLNALLSYGKSTVAQEQTALTDRERQAIEQVAAQRGITFEEASEQLAKEGLASRVKRRTGHRPAKVIQFPPRKPWVRTSVSFAGSIASMNRRTTTGLALACINCSGRAIAATTGGLRFAWLASTGSRRSGESRCDPHLFFSRHRYG
jgi:hypothetical protein